jgi:autophagy-related protein 9
VAFISGSFAAVLFLVSLIDPELFLGFEITKDRTVLFYLGLFGTILAVSRGMIPEENLVFEPEAMLSQVIEYTHYCPDHWKGKLHSDEVKNEFSALYTLKIMVFLEEVLSVLTTPFILWFSLPDCSDRVVDFFREFTVHVDGMGYVCSFAEFNFQRQGRQIDRARLRDERMTQKLEQSILNFRNIHPDWMPGDLDDDNSAYINHVNDPLRSVNAYRMGATNTRRHSPFLGFAANSHVAQASASRPPRTDTTTRRTTSGTTPKTRQGRFGQSEYMSEMESRSPELKLESELGDSFLSPSQAVGEVENHETQEGNQGVLGLLNQLYQETGTGKGIGI